MHFHRDHDGDGAASIPWIPQASLLDDSVGKDKEVDICMDGDSAHMVPHCFLWNDP